MKILKKNQILTVQLLRPRLRSGGNQLILSDRMKGRGDRTVDYDEIGASFHNFFLMPLLHGIVCFGVTPQDWSSDFVVVS